METEKCGSCFYSLAGAASGECHRNAPQRIHGVGTGSDNQKWPCVNDDDWCGEFTPASVDKGVGG